MSRLPSVQRFYVRLRDIADDTLFLADGRPRAIFQVEPSDLLLADDDARETATTGLEGFLHRLHGLNIPLQIVYDLVPADLDRHAGEIEALAATRTGRLAVVGRQVAAFERHLGRTGSLLQPRLLVVIGLDAVVYSPGTRLGARLAALAGWRPRRRGCTAEPNALPTATEQLDERGEAVAGALDRLGVRWRRLGDTEIAALLAACWSPERARRERLRPPGHALVRTPPDRIA